MASRMLSATGSAAIVGVGQQDEELLAPEPAREVAAAQARL